MKLALITDTAQPGESGVGDYSLIFAAKLETLGVTTEVLPIGYPESSQRKVLAERLALFQPDWVSFQFVPYSYAPRGLVNRRTLPWKNLRGRLGTHFMFHEIWIGSHCGARLRDRAVGWFQRRGIQSIMQQLQPDVVHCSNRLYSAQLKLSGIANQLLPLIGNIPVLPFNSDPYEAVVSSFETGNSRQGWLVAVFFGTIHPNSGALNVIRWLSQIASHQGRQVLVVSLGRCPNAEIQFENWAAKLGESSRVRFLIKGQMPPDELSAWITAADCGLATTPYNIIEKSGSAIAFAEHGLPVLVTDGGSPARSGDVPADDLSPRFCRADSPALAKLQALPLRQSPKSFLDDSATQFLNDLRERSGL